MTSVELRNECEGEGKPLAISYWPLAICLGPIGRISPIRPISPISPICPIIYSTLK